MGASKWEWTDGGAQSFTADLHIQKQEPNLNRPVYVAESLDGSVIEAISIGSGQEEIRCVVTEERDATGLRDFQDALRRRLSMTFTPDLDAPGTTFTVTAAGGVPQVQMVSEGNQSPRYGLGPITLRRLDGGSFWP